MIPLPPKMKELLAAQRREQLEMRLAAGPEWTNNDLVFCTEFGTPFEGRNMTRSLHQTLRRARLPLRGVHALRHPYVKVKTKLLTQCHALSSIFHLVLYILKGRVSIWKHGLIGSPSHRIHFTSDGFFVFHSLRL